MNQENKQSRFKFIKQCVRLRPSSRFQSWDNLIKDYSWHTYADYSIKGRIAVLLHCDELLRNSIESDKISEYRIDIDEEIISCINTAKKINQIMLDNNINITWYASGGKGLHGHFLFDISKIKIDLSNIQSRMQLKKLMLKYFKLDQFNNLDNQLLSSEQVLTLEGARKRRKIDVKTGEIIAAAGNRKILININQTSKEILTFLAKNKDTFLINENYFNEINDLPEGCINYIEKSFVHDVKNPIKDKVKSNDIQNQLNSIKIKECNCNSKKYKYYTLAIIYLYKKYNFDTSHRFIYYCLRVLYDITHNTQITINEVKKIINCLSLISNDNLENQIDKIKQDNNNVYYGFKQGEEGRRYDQEELLTLVGKLQQTIPLNYI